MREVAPVLTHINYQIFLSVNVKDRGGSFLFRISPACRAPEYVAQGSVPRCACTELAGPHTLWARSSRLFWSMGPLPVARGQVTSEATSSSWASSSSRYRSIKSVPQRPSHHNALERVTPGTEFALEGLSG